MDIISKGTLIRVSLAILFIIGFFIFLTPVFSGIINVGNTVGMIVYTALFFITIFWKQLFAFVCEHRFLRIISIVAVIISALLIIMAIVISFAMISAANSPPPNDTTVIVLGCKVRGNKPSLMLHKRIMAAYEYLEENSCAMCIVSGGQGSDELISEAECMKNVLVENGIPENRIIIEDRSTSTDENMLFSMKKMEENGISGDVVVVTNEFHQLRAGMIAEKYGLKTYSVSASTAWYLLPTYWLREWFGVTYQFFFG